MSNKEVMFEFRKFERASDLILHDGYLQLVDPIDRKTFISFMNNFYNQCGKDFSLKIPIDIFTQDYYNKSNNRYKYVGVNFVRDYRAIYQGISEMLKITQNTLKISPHFIVVTETSIYENLNKICLIYNIECIKLDKQFEIKRDKNQEKNILELYDYIINTIDHINDKNNNHIFGKEIIGICNIIYKFYL